MGFRYFRNRSGEGKAEELMPQFLQKMVPTNKTVSHYVNGIYKA